MPDFRTILKIPGSTTRIAISERIFTIGSCFSDAIGERLAGHKMETYANPAGVIYNPHAIHRVLQLAIQGGAPAEGSFVSGELTFHYDFHSSLFANSRALLHNRLTQVISDCQINLQKATWLIITYGTAWVYRHKSNGEIVANCHKQPSLQFEKSLLSANDIESSFRDLHRALTAFNPSLKIILTVSPVRHLKDSLEGNSVSKSILRVACDNMVNDYANVFYFPAYEIMLDDLRDYRFYKADMIHPNAVAEEYIWEQFATTWFNEPLLAFIKSWKDIRLALQHRPFHPDTEAHRNFLRATLQKIDAWSSFVNVEDERFQILDQLVAT